MDSDWNTSIKEINGINLENYYIQRRSYNSVVYVHKKFLEEPKPVEEKSLKVKTKKEKKSKQEKKLDKCQQFTNENYIFKDHKTYNTSGNNNTVLDQTIKFAKNIVPLVIPPDDDKSNAFYTIKTYKKPKHKDKKRDSCFEQHELARDAKKVVETYRKVKKESISVQESISHSSNNTLDDLNINQSLCCTLSEVSEKKYNKKDKHHSKKANREHKFAISESFEAVATENIEGDAKIKIHLMNEKDKYFLSDTIKEPVLNAIRDCILELNNNSTNTDQATVQKFIKCNSQKLDNILNKLTCIEKKLDAQEIKLQAYERNLDNQQSKLNFHEQKLHTYENRLDSHEVKLDSQERKLDSHEIKINSYVMKVDSHAVQLNSHEEKFKLETNINSRSKEEKFSAREMISEVEDKKVLQPKVQHSNPKTSTLEELGEDLIEMDEEFTSEEELHQELLDRRSKSTIVEELVPKITKEKKFEALGGGEVPPTAKNVSIGAKLERPNRIPARFCWTDTVRKN